MKRIIPTFRTVVMLPVATLLVLGLGACSSTPEKEPDATGSPSEFNDAGATDDTTPRSSSNSDLSLPVVYFDFDKADIRQDAVAALKTGATALQDTGSKVVVAGHTDSRGSEEYNLALGERRAAAVRRYLSNLGVSMNQMTIVSYGEVRPAVTGNSPAAWSKNRRAEFQVIN